MTTYAVLLRAINVGGRNKIPMAELRELLDDIGLCNVATYIQSGNIICSSTKKPAGLSKAIKTAIAERFGHDIEVISRAAADLALIVDGFPYPDADPKSSGVVFLSDSFDGDLDAAVFAPDECVVAASGTDVFVNCPNRFSDTKLTAAWIEKQTGCSGTRRNWATVLKLHEMAG